MGATLTGTTVAAGYTALLKTSDSGSISSSLKAVADGDGTDSALQISTAGVKSTGFLRGTDISFDDGTTRLATKVLDIGDWNMDSTATVSIAHGISGIRKIKTVFVTIIDDAETSASPLNGESAGSAGVAGGYIGWDGTNIDLTRFTGERFDDAAYNSTSFNRGYVTITYDAT